jgi:hypothetical protein
MTYSQNQFYKIGVYEKDVGIKNPDFRNDQDNPNFIWPSKTNLNAVTGVDKEISRGYMRLISTAFGKDYTELGKRRLHFQFNPETLSRNVTARNDVQLWMNQDPIQFTQPIPGDANFNFELIFNREHEVSSGTYRTANGSVVEGNTNYSAINNDTAGTVNSIYDPASVTQIGVLADIAVFDQIIGQGINKDLIDALASKAKKDIDAYNAQKKKEAKSQGVDVEDIEAVIPGQVEASDTNIDKTLKLGIGNSAFIVSQPIRIVFSSLYMVEGFITSTNVTFDKFNPSMVPVQCRIAVSMQAMYIGFAAKKTFLSNIYEDVAQTDYENGTTTPEGKAELPELQKVGLNLWEKIINAGTDPSGYTEYTANPYIKVMQKDKLTDGNSIEYKIALRPTDAFKDWATKFSGTGAVTATCEWIIKYYGRSSSGTSNTITNPKPTGTGFDGTKKPIVFARRAEYKIDLTDVRDNRESLEFKFDRPQYAITSSSNPPKPNYGDWDTNELAVWESIINITFTIDGSSATNVECDQMIQGKQTSPWNSASGEGTYEFHPHVMCKIIPTGGKDFKFDSASEEAG